MQISVALNCAGWATLGGAALYVLIAAFAQRSWSLHQSIPVPNDEFTSVSILKPLCGPEPRLYQNLRSFCLQSHTSFQLIFGARFSDDPALEVARRLQREFPGLDICVVCDARIHGRNLKISNLLNMLPQAKHDLLVFSDSDIEVGPDYLGSVIAPLQDTQVGLVTCLYRGRALGGLWARLGKQFIDDWFRPAVLVMRLFGSSTFGFGASLAMRRDVLDSIGGLEALNSNLADDYALGALARARGFRTVLSAKEVSTDVTERRLQELAAHELRWLRTIRMLQPLGYGFCFVTFTIPAAFLGWLLVNDHKFATPLLVMALSARLLAHLQSTETKASMTTFKAFLVECGMLPLRDLLSLVLWLTAFFGSRVSWRGQSLTSIGAHNISSNGIETSEIS